MRILALDVGERRIGVAISDPTGTIASPVAVIERGSGSGHLDEILRLAREHEAERILVGIPISMDGVAREQAARVQQFVAELAQRSPVPVATCDERLSTVEAQRRMRESGASARRRREMVDAVAAAVILQAYLDAGKGQGSRYEAQGPGCEAQGAGSEGQDPPP